MSCIKCHLERFQDQNWLLDTRSEPKAGAIVKYDFWHMTNDSGPYILDGKYALKNAARA